MSWGEIASIVSSLLALTLFIERLVHRLLRGKYVTTDQLENLEKTTTDTLLLQGSRIKEVDHRVDLVVKDLDSKPGYEHFNALKESLAETKEGWAVNNTTLNHVNENVREIKDEVRRLVERMTNAPKS